MLTVAYHRTYPEMSVILRAPMEIENMLLCDMRCAISGENPQKQVPNEISPGSILPVHHLHLGQLIRFTADISDSEGEHAECAKSSPLIR